MRIIVIGGTGHIGTYLVPRLVASGHDVTVLSRQRRTPYQPSGAWASVRQIAIDREEEEQAGTFGTRVRELSPDVVVDLICFTEASARMLLDALDGHVQHFLHCGTIWVHGYATVVPATEALSRKPFGDYGVRKAAIEALLLDAARRRGFPATLLHPGLIVGPGWTPINPAGNLDPVVFSKLAAGQEVALPDLGLATLHHVHADDVAQCFERAIDHWSVSVGESFHVASPAAVSLRGLAEAVASWFGREANLVFQPWEQWRQGVTPDAAEATWSHIAHSPCASIEKAQRLLGYRPRYTSHEAIREALTWLIAQGTVTAPSMMA